MRYPRTAPKMYRIAEAMAVGSKGNAIIAQSGLFRRVTTIHAAARHCYSRLRVLASACISASPLLPARLIFATLLLHP